MSRAVARVRAAARGVGESLAVALLWALHRGLPERLSRRLVRGLAVGFAALARRTAGKRVAIARANLSACFPAWSPADVERVIAAHYRVAAQVLLDYGFLWFGDEARHRRRIEIEGFEHFAAARAAGRPIVILAPHALALDFGGLRLSLEAPGVSFAKPMKNARVEALNHRSRTRYGGIIVHRHEGLRRALRALRDGCFFYYLPDEDLGTEGACFVPFFGVPKATLTALSRVARVGRAVVIPSFSEYDRERDTYRLVLGPPLADFPTDDACADARAMNAAIETMVARAPEQYLWTLKLFKTRPAGEPDFYRRTAA